MANLGGGWRHNFDRSLLLSGSSTIYAKVTDGKVLTFTKVGSDWTTTSDIVETLVESGTNFILTDAADTVETYDSTGKLVSIVNRRGYSQTMAYDSNGRLATVTDSYSRQLTFTYNGNGLLDSVTDPDGREFRYIYENVYSFPKQTPNRLSKVVYPDLTLNDPDDNPTRTYLYEDANYPYALTGILDENGAHFATWAYDSEGRATSSQHAGGAESTTIVYNVDGSRTVTNPLGKIATYNFTTVAGKPKLTQIDGQASLNCPATSYANTYDANGFVASATDREGNVTNYVKNNRGLETSRTEAFGTADARTITTAWHGTFRLPTQVVEPGRTTDFVYDLNGNLTSRTITDTTSHTLPYSTNGQTRAWTYTYNATGQLLTVNGPRNDVVDTTTYAYDISGALTTITNALNQATSVTAHNARGLPLSIVDENGVTSELAYDVRGWLVSRTVKDASGDATTSFGYDAAGQIISVTQPNGARLNYEYDDAHRLTAVSNDLNERIEYTLDAMGNPLAEVVKSTTGVIVRTQTRVFDELGRLLKSIGAANQTTTYAYDKNGNVVSITDPLSQATIQAFDALNRLVTVTDSLTGVATNGYDALDNLTSVTDQRGLVTSYTYNGFGDVIQVSSPDTGATVYTLDSAGNRVSETDARAVVTNRTFDALNRVTAKTFPADTTQNVTYAYDDQIAANKGVGRLTSITDNSGSSSFVYDSRGNVAQETRVIATKTYVTKYGYDLADNVLEITYPSGRIVTYSRDTLGRVTAIATRENAAGAPVTVANNIAYQPFGPVSSLDFGNGQTLTYQYDSDYRLTKIVTSDGITPVQDVTLTYDGVDNITAITDAVDATRSQTFQYDQLHRLSQAVGLYDTIDYTYDGVGNRLTRSVTAGATTTDTYSYALDSNRLQSVSDGTVTRALAYTANGNTATDDRGSDPDVGFNYDQNDRLAQVSLNALPSHSYGYNAFGERVTKSDAAGLDKLHFHYDQSGRLLGESDDQGAFIRSYIYLDGLPIAQLDPSSGGGATIDVLVDNSDPANASIGTWAASAAGQGFEGSNFQVHAIPDPVPAGGMVIDNTDAGFNFVGPWTSEATIAGYEGTDYQIHDSAIPPVSDIIVDNAGPEFSTIGTWGTSTWTLGGALQGSNYRYSVPNTEIIDNTDAGFSVTGPWLSSTSTGLGAYIGSNVRYRKNDGTTVNSIVVDNSSADFNVTGPWSTSNSTGTGAYIGSNVRYRKSDGTTTNSIIVDNADAGFSVTGIWSTSTWTGAGALIGADVRYKLPNSPTAGSIVVDNTDPGFSSTGTWSSETTTVNGPYIGSNILYKAANTTSPDTATWTPAIPASKQYKVYAWWTARSNRATDAKYTVHHAGGSTVVTVDQTLNGSQWNFLGVFAMDPGAGHRVDLSNDANNYVMADAIQFTATDEVPNAATWTPVIPASNQYNVYAWWNAHSFRASDAKYIVHHAGGATTVTVNQEINGSQWNLLGTFAMDPASNHRVELTDQANGQLIADAIQIAPVNDPPFAATWTLPIPASDQYKVYAWWTPHANRATDAKYIVHHAGGATTVTVNQEINGNQWYLLGTFAMDPASNHRVELTDQANEYVIADAIQIAPVNDPPYTATWIPTIPSSQQYKVYAWWTAHANRASDAKYTIHHAGGATTVTVNQEINGSQWNLLGTFAMDPASNHRVELTDQANEYVIADAIQIAPVNSPQSKAIWTPNLTVKDYYDVYARWPAWSGYSPNAPFTIHHAEGDTTVLVNQQINGGQWMPLGTFVMEPGSTIDLGDTQNGIYNDGFVAADAVRLVPSATLARFADWSFTVPSTDRYKVFAKWTELADRATAANYTVTHAGGSTVATVNQRQNGGQWNLLGEFTFNGGNSYHVELTNAVSGVVVADAIYVVKVPAVLDSFTWSPTIPSAGNYDVYAKWSADSGRAGDALYGVYHDGGLAQVTVDQRSNGGQWYWLGNYAFDPANSPIVVLAANDNGTVAADAVRFIGQATPLAQVAYIHDDHLNTPQVMTDAAGAVTWNRAQTPFGLTASLTGTGNNSLRFPGQYADAEAGLNYNYFRDYDPTLGRYIQSDPVGLTGGLNTYGYVYQNPVRYIDPTGQFAPLVVPVIEGLVWCATNPYCAGGVLGILAWGTAQNSDVCAINPDLFSDRLYSKDIPQSKLGPSKEPKIHNKDHNSRKKAKEAAAHEGRGAPAHDPSPADGRRPHYHPTDSNGKRIPGGPHHRYPKRK